MKQFSKKTILFQIFCGILFTCVANPYLLYKTLVPSKILVVLVIFVNSFLLLKSIIRQCKDDVVKAIALGYFQYNKNFFVIVLGASFLGLFLSNLYGKYLIKTNVDPFICILLPAIILYLVILLVSYKIRKRCMYKFDL